MVSQYEHGPDFQTPNEARIAELENTVADLLFALKRCEAMVSSDQGPPNWDWIREVISKATA